MIVGSSSLSSGSSDHAFLYTAGHLIDLQTLGGADSVAFGINRTGTVVGQNSTAAGRSHAFAYSNGTMTDLAPFLVLAGFSASTSAANAIDDYGNIVGYGYIGEETHAFLLTIPEPGSANLLIFALLIMFYHAWRIPRARRSA
jgi:probable HAF family extracellular repeat protein